MAELLGFDGYVGAPGAFVKITAEGLAKQVLARREAEAAKAALEAKEAAGK